MKHKHLVCVYVRTTPSLILVWKFLIGNNFQRTNWSVNSFTVQSMYVCVYFCLFVCLSIYCVGAIAATVIAIAGTYAILCSIRFIHPHWISHFEVVLICVSCKQCILCAKWRECHYTNWNGFHVKFETMNKQRCLTFFQLDLNGMAHRQK